MIHAYTERFPFLRLFIKNRLFSMKQQIQVNNKKRQEYIDVWQKPSQCCKVIILDKSIYIFDEPGREH